MTQWSGIHTAAWHVHAEERVVDLFCKSGAGVNVVVKEKESLTVEEKFNVFQTFAI